MTGKAKTDTPDTAAPIAPPFWIARVALPVGGEMGAAAGTLPVRAFNPGDRVPPDHVVTFGWQPYVDPPEGDWSMPEPAGDAEPDKEK